MLRERQVVSGNLGGVGEVTQRRDQGAGAAAGWGGCPPESPDSAWALTLSRSTCPPS